MLQELPEDRVSRWTVASWLISPEADRITRRPSADTRTGCASPPAPRLHHKVARSPWRFSAIPPGHRRFDLSRPHGTCYWSSRRYGAWVEVWRGVTMVDLDDALKRRLWVGHAPAMHLANLLSPRAYGYGITAALSTQPAWGLKDPARLRTSSGRIEQDTLLLVELASLGVHLAPGPYDVPTTPPNSLIVEEISILAGKSRRS